MNLVDYMWASTTGRIPMFNEDINEKDHTWYEGLRHLCVPDDGGTAVNEPWSIHVMTMQIAFERKQDVVSAFRSNYKQYYEKFIPVDGETERVVTVHVRLRGLLGGSAIYDPALAKCRAEKFVKMFNELCDECVSISGYYAEWFQEAFDSLEQNDDGVTTDEDQQWLNVHPCDWGEMFFHEEHLSKIVEHAKQRYPDHQLQIVGDPEEPEEHAMLCALAEQMSLTVLQPVPGDPDPRTTRMNIMRRSRVLYLSNSYFATIAGVLSNDDTQIWYPANAMYNALGVGTSYDRLRGKWKEYRLD